MFSTIDSEVRSEGLYGCEVEIDPKRQVVPFLHEASRQASCAAKQINCAQPHWFLRSFGYLLGVADRTYFLALTCPGTSETDTPGTTVFNRNARLSAGHPLR